MHLLLSFFLFSFVFCLEEWLKTEFDSFLSNSKVTTVRIFLLVIENWRKYLNRNFQYIGPWNMVWLYPFLCKLAHYCSDLFNGLSSSFKRQTKMSSSSVVVKADPKRLNWLLLGTIKMLIDIFMEINTKLSGVVILYVTRYGLFNLPLSWSSG